MSDPFRIFKADPSRQETLKILWPDLYECLARLDEAGPPEVLKCALSPCCAMPRKDRPVATARISEYGPPACAGHIVMCADRPGGWPLRRERKTK